MSAKHVAFVYAEDLWVADLDGKNPRRLTTDRRRVPPGLLAGRPDPRVQRPVRRQHRRLHDPRRRRQPDAAHVTTPAADIVRGFTPDGKAVLFSSNRNVFSNRHSQLFTVPLTGGMPTKLPIPWGFEAELLAGRRVHRVHPGPRRHRPVEALPRRHPLPHLGLQRQGPRHRRDPAAEGPVQRLRPELGRQYASTSGPTGPASTTCSPTTPETKEVQQVTKFTDFPVLDINTDGKKLIFEQAGYLHLLRRRVAADPAEDRRRHRRPGDPGRGTPRGRSTSATSSVSPSGTRAVVEFRGEIVTVPAEKGDPRNLTNSARRPRAQPRAGRRTARRSPTSPTRAASTNSSSPRRTARARRRRCKLTGTGFYSDLVWSPRLEEAAVPRQLRDASTGWTSRAGRSPRSWSREHGLGRGLKRRAGRRTRSGWRTRSTRRPRSRRVYVYSLEQDKSFPVTDGLDRGRPSRCSTRTASTCTSSGRTTPG